MITKVHLENFRCFKSETVELGPFNVLIGENDTGKSAFLYALRLARAAVPGVGFDQGLSHSHLAFGPGDVKVGTGEGTWIGLSFADTMFSLYMALFRNNHRARYASGSPASLSAPVALARMAAGGVAPGWQEAPADEAGKVYEANLADTAFYQLDPSALKRPSPMKNAPLGFDGTGFATFLLGILREDREAFFAMENRFYQRFPGYERIKTPEHGGDNAIVFTTRSGHQLPANRISDGTILFLAFLALAYAPARPRMVLVEEPENGIHHANLKEVVAVLKMIAEEKRSQVVITTHSPYLLDLVEPEEVLVFRRHEEGAHVKRMSEFPDVEQVKKHFLTGEIWTNLLDADLLGMPEHATSEESQQAKEGK